jgi:enoyl-CoA hydratase
VTDNSENAVLVEQRGRILIITINRPEAKNAVNAAVSRGLADAVDRLDSDPGLSVGIVTGAGGSFCAGMDLKAFARGENVIVEGRGMGFTEQRPVKPLIAAVEGYAVAGGTEMLQGTDIRVAGESAIFGVWEAKRGLFPLGGSACRLPRQMPYTLAMDILLTCRPITALEAQQMGLIGRVAPDGSALDVARAVAAQVAANAPLSTQAILRAWRETEHMSDYDAMQHQDPIGWAVFATEDAQEGPRAFAEKRPPNYTGK